MPQDVGVARIGWVSFHQASRTRGCNEEVLFSSREVPQDVMRQWEPRETQINMVEMLGAVAAVMHLAPQLRGLKVTLFVDSESVEGALIRGASKEEDQADLIMLFWETILDFDLSLYVARVPTDSNPSDGPSRGDNTELFARGAQWRDTVFSGFITDRSSWVRELERRAQRHRGGHRPA